MTLTAIFGLLTAQQRFYVEKMSKMVLRDDLDKSDLGESSDSSDSDRELGASYIG